IVDHDAGMSSQPSFVRACGRNDVHLLVRCARESGNWPPRSTHWPSPRVDFRFEFSISSPPPPLLALSSCGPEFRMLRGAFHFEVTPDGDLENSALNVEILRNLFLHPVLIDGDDLGPGNRGDFDHGAWHVACHIAGAGGVRRHANGNLMWLEISHRRMADEYCATVTLRREKAIETLGVDTAEGREALAGSSLVGFVEGTSLGRTSARGVLDPPDRFNLWRRQDFDQPIGSEGDGGKVWEHWCTLRDIRPSHSIGTSMLTALV